MKSKALKLIFIILTVIFTLLIVICPDICKSGAANGILLSGRVIIPSLFPFTVCVLFIVKSGFLDGLDFIKKPVKKLFGITPQLFIIMLLSFIGGYPIGAKLLNEATEKRLVSPKTSGIMLCYCVNAGPAFIILAVGQSLTKSMSVGYILLGSHIFAALIISLALKPLIKESLCYNFKSPNPKLADTFVLSVSDAAGAVFSICAYVILFSTLSAYAEFYGEKYEILKLINRFLEVTNAVLDSKNLLFISFLLGFAGISIWCQILSIAKSIKINFPLFLLSRIVHGGISTLSTYLLLKLLKIPLSVSAGLKAVYTYENTAISLSLLCMIIVLIISLTNKKSTGNILKDIV